jgi:excisionase family DNA binding protein
LPKYSARLHPATVLLQRSLPIAIVQGDKLKAAADHHFAKVAYRVDEFCALTGLGRSKIYQEISACRLKAIKCGNRTLITAAAAKQWLDTLPAKER